MNSDDSYYKRKMDTTEEGLERSLASSPLEKGMTSTVGNCVPFINDERDIFITLGLGAYFKEPFERTGSIFQ